MRPPTFLVTLDGAGWGSNVKCDKEATVAASSATVLQAVTRRLASDPDRVLPTLRLLADPDALPDADDVVTIELAQRINEARLAGALTAFRARALTTGEVREALGGVSRQAVAFRVSQRQLLALEIGGRLFFPSWQFGAEGAVPRIREVVDALLDHGRSVLAADRVMLTPIADDHGSTPADLLAQGDVDRVLHYVRAAGEQS
ncbi:hypothetical protein acdb102_41990 [Acidothermaceae bacterium B102]|nr:hypothetical protein acdb102_41990 [Acidothermaceae bacterium B102]